MPRVRYDGTNAAEVAALLGLDETPQPFTPTEEQQHPEHDPVGEVLPIPLRHPTFGVSEVWIRPGTWVVHEENRDYTLDEALPVTALLTATATPPGGWLV